MASTFATDFPRLFETPDVNDHFPIHPQDMDNWVEEQEMLHGDNYLDDSFREHHLRIEIENELNGTMVTAADRLEPESYILQYFLPFQSNNNRTPSYLRMYTRYYLAWFEETVLNDLNSSDETEPIYSQNEDTAETRRALRHPEQERQRANQLTRDMTSAVDFSEGNRRLRQQTPQSFNDFARQILATSRGEP